MASYDLLFVGNAIIDLVAEADFSFLENLAPPGGMTLVSAEEVFSIQEKLQIKQISGGGSAANSAVSSARMGLKVAYLGKVSRDKEGADFARDLYHEGIFFPSDSHASDSHASEELYATARCVIIVTPDKQRTMFTYLGASVAFSLEDISSSLIKESKITYLEGYLFDKKEAKKAFYHIASLAKSAGNKVALTLSDVFCVQSHKQDFLNFIKEHVDIIFANEAEICALYDVNTYKEARSLIEKHIPLIIITCGANGAVILEEGEESYIPAEPTKVVDTTGAGDAFAAGFLSAYLLGKNAKESAFYGHKVAAHVIGHFGGRPAKDFSIKIE